ncbi:MAG: hypothetical protein P1V20_09300 [Verrucomicrobiales bacterium]|nr:hypothetical protein [Verrucomicrobiales bacterium]
MIKKSQLTRDASSLNTTFACWKPFIFAGSAVISLPANWNKEV